MQMLMATGAQYRCLELVKASLANAHIAEDFLLCVHSLFTNVCTNSLLFAQSFASAPGFPGRQEYSFASFTFPRVSIQSTLVTRSNAINNILCVGLASGTTE